MRALEGKTILVTRAAPQAVALKDRFEKLGARVVVIPLIEIRSLSSLHLDGLIGDLPSYDWLVFTSANGVRVFAERAIQLGQWPLRGSPEVAVVGPATGHALQRVGGCPSLSARRHQAEGLLEEIQKRFPEGLSGLRFLLPLAIGARPVLADGLTSSGAHVDSVATYESRAAESSRDRLNMLLAQSPPDLITLTSSSTAKALVDLCDDFGNLRSMPCAAIGPVTALTAGRLGLNVVVTPERSTTDQLAEATSAYFSGKASGNC